MGLWVHGQAWQAAVSPALAAAAVNYERIGENITCASRMLLLLEEMCMILRWREIKTEDTEEGNNTTPIANKSLEIYHVRKFVVNI